MPPEPLAVVAEQNATHVDTETRDKIRRKIIIMRTRVQNDRTIGLTMVALAWSGMWNVDKESNGWLRGCH